MKPNIYKFLQLLLVLIFLYSFPHSKTLLCAYKPLDKEQVAEMVNSTKRTIVPLEGVWERSTDDGATWNKVKIPYTDYEEGKVIYKKGIKLDNDFINKNNLHFYFLGLSQQIDIYFNGVFIIKIDGYFLPADIAIPSKLLINGNNEIRLEFLENSHLDYTRTLAIVNAPKMAKGIIREPFLIGTSRIYISELIYKLKNMNSIEVSLQCS
jgi:hypothetical protein